MEKMQKKKMTWAICLSGAVIGAAALGLAIWNSKQVQTMRKMKQAGRLMNGVGKALCNISGVMDEI